MLLMGFLLPIVVFKFYVFYQILCFLFYYSSVCSMFYLPARQISHGENKVDIVSHNSSLKPHYLVC